MYKSLCNFIITRETLFFPLRPLTREFYYKIHTDRDINGCAPFILYLRVYPTAGIMLCDASPKERQRKSTRKAIISTLWIRCRKIISRTYGNLFARVRFFWNREREKPSKFSFIVIIYIHECGRCILIYDIAMSR